MNNFEVITKKDKKIRKISVMTDRDALKIFNKYYKKFELSKYKLTAYELKTIGYWIKDELAVRSIPESELEEKMKSMLIPRFNTEILIRLCKKNDINELTRLLNDPEFIFIPDYSLPNKLSTETLLFSENKNHSREVLELILSKTSLTIGSFSHQCLKNCEVDEAQLAITSSFYKSYDEFAEALKLVARLKPETYTPKVLTYLLKKQHILIYL